MGKATGFLETGRAKPLSRPVAERVKDWREIYLPVATETLAAQASRCMDCGIPFCHQGCPLGNVIPDWNDLVYRDRWRDAIIRLHATNNFPEFTGRLCPAPCESSCVLAIGDDPVNIKAIEQSIVDRAFDEGWIVAHPPTHRTGKRVAVIGSGPAGLAVADQLNRAGHSVAVFERTDRIGGLLRYGIPEFKMEKRVLDRRLGLLKAEGIEFKTNMNVGVTVPVEQLRKEHDAIVLAIGSTRPRDLAVPGRDLRGIHFAMDYLTLQNRQCEASAAGAARSPAEGDLDAFMNAKDKRVVIIGGGDTGADCLGTVHRQGARSVQQLELMPQPPATRASDNPWPQWPNVFRVSGAHEEGGERVYAVATERFTGDSDGRVCQVHLARVDIDQRDGRPVPVRRAGSEFTLAADLVLLAMGFAGPETTGLLTDLGVAMTDRGTVARDDRWMTSVPGVFACGDAQRGQSLIVWAIADGRAAAEATDRYLAGE